jgi:XTP/dITP diphosphohydrolase
VIPGQQLVLASNNAGKLREFRELWAARGVGVVNQASLGIDEAPEPHRSFVENALAKARHACAASGLAALADDSGLCVSALRGAPGVDSAVYAQVPAADPAIPFQPIQSLEREAHRRLQDQANNARLLGALHAWSQASEREAIYVCVLVLVRYPDDPLPVIAQGLWKGQILLQPRGTGGFGYDPLFWVPEEQCTVAEMPLARKNQISHRAQAMRQLMNAL